MEAWKTHLQMAETAIRQANLITANRLERTVDAHTTNAIALIDASEEVGRAVVHLSACVVELAEVVPSKHHSPEADQEARQRALQAVGLLRAEMEKCPPSRMAEVLHL